MQFIPLVLLGLSLAPSQAPTYDRKDDVVYGRKYGFALTLDVLAPKEKKNGAGVIFVASGGWFSDKSMIAPANLEEFLRRGYVVFAVMHACQPRFTIPEVLDDINRSVRYVRHHAKEYGVDPERLGIMGASAGGHLSLMQGCAPRAGDPKAADPVDRESAKVEAVACFFPPTDFLNYGRADQEALGTGVLKGFKAPFDFVEFNSRTNSFDLVTDPDKRREIGKQISPITHVSETSAPTLIIHGDADNLVPLQQAQIFLDKMKAAKVPCELVVKKKGGHGWGGIEKDFAVLADWFDKYLLK
jgi:acetyl esterase/lipase